MKQLIGLILIIIGILFGLFIGIWLCLIGGIVQIIKEIQNPEGAQALFVAIGITRILFAGFAGWLAAIILIIPGQLLIQE